MEHYWAFKIIKVFYESIITRWLKSAYGISKFSAGKSGTTISGGRGRNGTRFGRFRNRFWAGPPRRSIESTYSSLSRSTSTSMSTRSSAEVGTSFCDAGATFCCSWWRFPAPGITRGFGPKWWKTGRLGRRSRVGTRAWGWAEMFRNFIIGI